MNKGQDLEDTLQCLCSKKHDCIYIVRSDKGFVDCGIHNVNVLITYTFLKKFPNSKMNCSSSFKVALSNYFEYPKAIKKVIYTINIIESVHMIHTKF